jgi:hypothetical protein
LGAAGCSPLIGRTALAQESALPLVNLGLEHLDILVPDVAESARFYKQVFDAPLHEQPFRRHSTLSLTDCSNRRGLATLC